MPAATPSVSEASAHLYEALSHHTGPIDLAANDPLVLAVAEYGQRSREHDDEGVAAASKKVWAELSRHKVTLDLSAADPVVKALSEYGDACRREGPRK